MGYTIVNGKIVAVTSVGNLNYNNKAKANKADFAGLLNNEVEKSNSFTISAHAANRLKARGINLDSKDMKTINDGINKAADKGCQNSVMLYKDTAYVTSIKNRTIVTAVDKESCKQNVFTNIDSVIIL